VADSYAHLSPLDVVVPFLAGYRPLWTGLGTVAADLVIALVATSLLRLRIGRRAWRGVHWLAYAAWPVALAHGLGAGTDARTVWMLTVTVGCVGLVLAAVAARLTMVGAARPAPALPVPSRTPAAAGSR
jgi:sulfoxide reductase heme-binding subunit YedZ